jgi:hypothetical protein
MEAAQDPGLDARLHPPIINRDSTIASSGGRRYTRDTARNLATRGIFCGVSDGARAAALELAKTLEPGSVVLAMIRTPANYLGAFLFEGISKVLTTSAGRIRAGKAWAGLGLRLDDLARANATCRTR